MNSDVNTVLTGAGYQFIQGVNKPVWLMQNKFSSGTDMLVTYYSLTDAGAELKNRLTVTSATDKKIVASSRSKKCVVIVDSTTGSNALHVANMYSASSTDLSAAVIRTVTASLYSGITLTDVETIFDVSDDCSGLKVNDKILHWDTSAYVADTVGAVTGLSFSEDFSYAVADAGIYQYTPKSGATAGSYDLITDSGTYSGKKILYKQNSEDGANLVLLTYPVAATAGKFAFKLYALATTVAASTTFTKIDESTGTVTGEPVHAFSERLSKLVVRGTDPLYFVKNVDWQTKTLKTVTLPTTITGDANEIAVSDNFLYARNSDSSKAAPKHYGYVFSSSSLIESFN